MKKLLHMFFLLFFISLNCTSTASDKIPIDSNIKCGQLENGLTYYIMNNSSNCRKQEISFQFVTRACPIFEDTEESGITHLIEHLSFTSKNFPNGIIPFVERNGGRVGHNMNAFTRLDQTYYLLKDIIVKNNNVLDSCLLVLHDWSGYAYIDKKAVEKEKPIVLSEFNRTPDLLNAERNRCLLKETPYTDVSILGTSQSISSFTVEGVKKYYEKWYKPDIQAIIIVGDIDVDSIEEKIIKLFSTIPTRNSSISTEMPVVPDNKEPVVCFIRSDKAENTSIEIAYKHNIIPKDSMSTIGYYRNSYIRYFVGEMLHQRLDELTKLYNSLLLTADAYYGTYLMAIPKKAWNLQITASAKSDSEIEKALTLILQENQRAIQFGFLQKELDRIKTRSLKDFENNFSQKISTQTFIDNCREHFIKGKALPSVEYEHQLLKQIFNGIALNDVNACIKNLTTKDNITVYMSGGKDTNFPIKKTVVNLLYKEYDGLSPYQYVSDKDKLIEIYPPKGSILKKETDTIVNSRVLTLSNGVKVILKKTDFGDNRISILASAKGGKYSLSEKNAKYSNVIADLVKIGGLGNLNSADLARFIENKIVKAMELSTDDKRTFLGYASKEDLETLFQMVHLMFTNPHKDEPAFERYRQNLLSKIETDKKNPHMILQDSLNAIKHGSSPYRQTLTVEDVKKLDYDYLMNLRNEYYQDVSSFNFIIVGNFNEEIIEALAEQYIASLSNKGHSPASRYKPEAYKGYTNRNLAAGNKQPLVFNQYSTNIEYNLLEICKLELLKRILGNYCTESIRSQGVYEINIGKAISLDSIATIDIKFKSPAQQVIKLNKIAEAQLLDIAEKGPKINIFNNTKKILIDDYTKKQKENFFWLEYLDLYYLGKDIDSYKYIDSITPLDIQKLAKQFISDNNHINIII